MKGSKTWFPTPKDVQPNWVHIDATGRVLGELASDVSRILRGKHKPTYTPHEYMGDYVVVTNVEKMRFTGKKLDDKNYYRHSGYIGSLRTFTLRDMLSSHPDRILSLAVQGMLPHTNQRPHLMSRLKVYAGPKHPHEAQLKGYGAEVKAR